MFEYNYLLNDITTNMNSVVSFELFCFVVFAFLLSLVIDIIFGELPTRIHPVVIVGSLINFFKNVFIKIKNKMSGLLVIIGVLCFKCNIIYYLLYFIIKCYFIVYCIFNTSIIDIFRQHASPDCC